MLPSPQDPITNVIQRLVELNCNRDKGLWIRSVDGTIVDQSGKPIDLSDKKNSDFILAIVNASTEVLDHCLELEKRSHDLRSQCDKLKDALELTERLKKKDKHRPPMQAKRWQDQ